MDVSSACPLRVGSIVWQPRPGAYALTVVCKATYVLAAGTSSFTGEQDEVHARDIHWEGPQSSLRHATDLVPFKRRPEVLLVGHAYAPGGQPVPSLVARLVVGDMDKAIGVSGDRWIGVGDHVSDPKPFARMPLRWERAAGGPGTRNPAGMVLEAPGLRGPVPLPNLAPPGVRTASWRDAIPPSGFGPLCPAWPERIEKLHHHAPTWEHARWFTTPLPDGVDGAYFNAAPADQQVTEIRADEHLVLEHLHPRHARLVTNLQPVEPRVTATPAGGPEQALRLRRDTLMIDTDRGIASLVWRATMVLSHPQQSGRVVVTLDAGSVPSWIARFDAQAAELPATLPLDSALASAAVASLPPVVRAAAHLAGTAMLDPAKANPGPALPFVGGPSVLTVPSAPLPQVARAPAALAGTMSTDAILVRQGAALPFGSATPPSAYIAAPVRFPAPEVPGPQAAPAPAATPGIPAPPPMLGPIAVVAEGIDAAAEPVAQATGVAADDVVSGAGATPEPPEPMPPRVLSIEEHAAIAASLARRKADRIAILEGHELTEATWQAAEQPLKDALREESSRGRVGLLQAYDDAYVAQLEVERGTITVEEYARLMVAAERGTEANVLADLGLPHGALLRVQRVWLRRAVASPALGRRLGDRIEFERTA